MQNCCIIGCETFKDTSITKPIFFKFPLHDKSLLEEWLRRIDRPDWNPSMSDLICGSHFVIDDVESDHDKKSVRLKPGAVPSLFPNKPVVLQLRKDQKGNLTAAQLKILTLKPSTQILDINPAKIIDLSNAAPSAPTDKPNEVNPRFVIKLTPITRDQLQKISHESGDATNAQGAGPETETIKEHDASLGLAEDANSDKSQTKRTIRKINILRKNVSVQRASEKEKREEGKALDGKLNQMKPILKICVNRRYNPCTGTESYSKRIDDQNEDVSNNNTHRYERKKPKISPGVQNERDSVKENVKADMERRISRGMRDDDREEFEKLIEEVRVLKRKAFDLKKGNRKKSYLLKRKKRIRKERKTYFTDLSDFSPAEDGEIIGEFKDDPSLKETDKFIDAMLDSNTASVFSEFLEPILIE